MRRWIIPLSATIFVASLLWGQEQGPQILFIAENELGKVWANTSLTRQRTEEPYLPMVVAVQNMAPTSVVLNRESIFLEDLDGIVYSMPTVKEYRKHYKKSAMDSRVVSFAGIPWEAWRFNRRLESANFFPDMQIRRGNTTIDSVSLRQRYGMTDLLYFERPRNLSLNRPFLLVVRPKKGWETPIRLRIDLS